MAATRECLAVTHRRHQPCGYHVQELLNTRVKAALAAHAVDTARLREELITRGVEIAAERERVELLKRKNESELAESERDHEQLVNYLTAKLGTKGEHSVFETIDNVAANKARLNRL